MNIIFVTQSGSIKMFYGLMKELGRSTSLQRIGFYVSHAFNYKQFCKDTPEITSDQYAILKEWDIIQAAKSKTPDLGYLRSYEKRLNNTNLWDVLVCDRRLYLGKRCTLSQDYTPRFSHQEMLSILQEGLMRIERFIDEVQPHAIIGYNCVTFGEMLFYLFAKARNIPFLNLRSLKIQSYAAYGPTIYRQIEKLQQNYENYLQAKIEDEWTEKARQYVELAQSSDLKYEGVRIRSRSGIGDVIKKVFKTGLKVLQTEVEFQMSGYANDNHAVNPLLAMWYTKVRNPWQAYWIDRHLSRHYVNEAGLPDLDYAFFPLHTEPEVSLLLHNKPYLNQIESVRLISHNLPIGMKLLVKDHPVAVGMRPLSYYQKLLEIPNVMLVHPSLGTKPLIKQAAIVITVAGSVAFEGILLRKPVLTLGPDHHYFLSRSMFRYVRDLNTLAEEIRDLLTNYQFDERALICYIAAAMRYGKPLNLYSSLLGRPARSGQDQTLTAAERYQHDLQELGEYTLESLAKFGALSLQPEED
jgi:hypothetical protein